MHQIPQKDQSINCFILKKNLYTVLRASMVAQMVKNPPAVQETWVQSLGWENPLEKEMVICFSILFFIIFIKKKFF